MAQILVIEDKPNQRALYTEEFRDEGYEIVCAADGAEALEIFKRQKPDLVVTDILLPGMTGIEVMERILAIDPHMPVIIHSAYSSPSHDFMASLAKAYVLKSGDLNELKTKIRETLSGRPENPVGAESTSKG